jgi:sterile alpha motif and leucine zipper-containing kinase AZK
VLRTLRHPRVLALLAVAVNVPPPYATVAPVTELMGGGSLYDVLHGGGGAGSGAGAAGQVRRDWVAGPEKYLLVALDVSSAMEYLHCFGVIHRDIKSPNILLDVRGRGKIADFGLSKIRSGGSNSGSSSSGVGVGTLRWMSPEMMKEGGGGADTDVFSFGVVLWELATGQLPWKDLAPVQIIGVVGYEGRCLQVPPHCLPSVAAIIRSCFRPQGARPSFGDLRTQLKAALAEARAMASGTPVGPPLPPAFHCPLSSEIMKDPVVAGDGFSYERSYMDEWLNSGCMVSPKSYTPLNSAVLLPNATLREAIRYTILRSGGN